MKIEIGMQKDGAYLPHLRHQPIPDQELDGTVMDATYI